jgi:GNAT superfamily N-acetyltransferase
VEVRTVSSRRERETFVRLPWRIYRGDPHWVPPLLKSEREFLDRGRNPFFDHAEAELFLAGRGDEPLGRIAAVHNRAHNEIHGDRVGFFGLFECVDDVDTARALFEAVSRWLARRGLDTARGPMNLSINDSCGVLVRGFDGPPFVLMPYNPSYYERLLEAGGFAKAKDILAYHFAESDVSFERIERAHALLARRNGNTSLRVRALDRRRWNGEIAVLHSLFNRSWEKNWSFVPFSEREFEHLAASMKPVVDADLVGILEVQDEPAGFGIALPDANLALREANGRLLPFGFAKVALARRRVKRVRVPLLGIVPEFRGRGYDVLIYEYLARTAFKKGYEGGETSWVLEDNVRMRRGIENLGGRLHRVYRLYDRRLA